MSRTVPRRTLLTLAALTALLAAGAYFLFRPVCVPISPDSLADFSPPIEQRRDETFYGTPLFRQIDGQWFQCKTWLSRQFFF